MLLIGLFMALSLSGAGWVMMRQQQQREAVAWLERGPACPRPARVQDARGDVKRFSFVDVGFSHRSGDASCAAIADKFGFHSIPACLFNSPEVLRVTTAKGVFTFGPRIYRPVTVTVENGLPRCVLNADYRSVQDTQ